MKRFMIVSICVLLFLFISIYSFAVQNNPSTMSPDKDIGPNISVQAMKGLEIGETPKATPLYGDLLSKIKISGASFNPNMVEEVAIYYSLSTEARVTVNIYDPDSGLVRPITQKGWVKAGENVIIWDGKDSDGIIVPDEVYFFTIMAEDKNGRSEIYDPVTFSGGVEYEIREVQINQEGGTVSYRMPEMGRVNIRLGIQGGPLLKTLVNWKTRLSGQVTEYWNGRDQDNLIDLQNHRRFKMVIIYYTLPENSMITYGNKTLTYVAYKEGTAKLRPVKKKRLRCAGPDIRLSPHWGLSIIHDRPPNFKVSLPKTTMFDKDGSPILKGKTLVHVALDEKERKFFQDIQYEICFFLDGEYYVEEEAGYSPYNWVWDTKHVKEGEHILTVNIGSFKDQVGVLSKKVKVVK